MNQASPDASAPCGKCAELAGNAIVLLATGIFFLFMTWICYGHTMDVPEIWKWGLAAYTAALISGIFWLAGQGFRVAVTAHCARKKAGIES